MLKRKKTLIIIAVLALALGLRIFASLTATFGADEVMYFEKSVQLAREGILNPIGPGSYEKLGGLFGPVMWVLYSIPLIFHATPLACSIFLALVNFLSIFLVFYVTSLLFNKQAAYIAALLYAFFPWPVIAPTNIWSLPFIPLIYTGFMIGIIKSFKNPKSPWIILCIFVLGVTLQLRIETYALFLVFILSIFLFKIKISLRYFLAGLALVLVMISPYIIYELKHGFENVQALIASKGGRFGPKIEFLKIFTWPIIVGSVEASRLVGTQKYVLTNYFHYFSITTVLLLSYYAVNLLAILASIKLFFKTVFSGLRKSGLMTYFSENIGISLLFTVIVVQFLFQLIMLYPVDRNYVFHFMPLMIILFAFWVDYSLKQGILARIDKWRIGKILFAVYFAAVIFIDVGVILQRFNNRDHSYNLEQIARSVYRDAGKDSFTLEFSSLGFKNRHFSYIFKHQYSCNFHQTMKKDTKFIYKIKRTGNTKSKGLFRVGPYTLSKVRNTL